MTESQTVEIDKDSLEELADYVADDLKQGMGPGDEYLEEAVRNAYNAIDE